MFYFSAGEMKRIGSYDMKRKIIIAEKGQTAVWEGTRSEET